MSTPRMTVLVVGATGSIGRIVVEEALRQGHAVRALVRNPDKARQLPPDAQVVVGDVTRPETLSGAVDGVDAIVFTLGSDGAGKVGAETVDYGGVRNVLAALGSRPARIALMTAIGVTNRTGAYNRSTEAHDWKRRSERLVRASGLPYTIVRPGWFDYNAPDEHRLVLLQGDTRQAGDPSDGAVARRQIAQVLVRSLTSDAAHAEDLRAGRHRRRGTRGRRRAVRRARCGSAGCARRRARHGEHAAGGRATAGPGRPGCGTRGPPDQRHVTSTWCKRLRTHRITRGTAMKNVIVVIGPGQIGQAIARRVGVGKHVLLADMRQENANAAAEVLGNAGYEVSVATVDVSSREAVQALVETATGLGEVTGLIHAAGVSPSQASPATILKVDLYGTALVLEEFGNVIARGGAGVVIASQSGHRLPPLTVEQNKALATTPVEELLGLPFLQPDQVTDSLHAYQTLEARELAARDGRGGALGQAGRAGQHDQPGHHHDPARQGRARRAARRRVPAHDRGVRGRARRHARTRWATVGALLMGPDGGFITGSDFLMDGGVTAAYWYGELAEVRPQP